MTKKKKVLISLLVVLLVFFAGISLLIGFYVTPKQKKYDELNTVEGQATVLRVETDTKLCKIYTNEYSCALKVYLNEIIDNNYLEDLYSGANITFRIPEFYAEYLEDERIEGLMIVSLKTNNAIIVTLESHNEMLKQGMQKLKIVALVFSGLFLTGSAICSVFLIICKVKKDPNK